MSPNSDRIAFHRAIAADPEDDTPRLVFADWLQEQGEDDRAEFIRLQCDLARRSAEDPDRRRLAERERVLLAEHDAEWRAELPPAFGFDWSGFQRGFIARVSVFDSAEFASVAARVFDVTPIHALDLAVELDADHAARLAKLPQLSQLTELRLAPSSHGAGDAVESLLRSPYLNSLRLLYLRSQRLTDANIRFLADLTRLAQLESLDLSDNEFGPQGAAALANSAHLSGLRRLSLFRNRIGGEGLRHLVDSPHLNRLEFLEVQNNAIHDDGIEALTRSDWIGRMDQLNLSYNYLGDRAARALAECRHCVELRTLVLRTNRIGDPGAVALAESAYLGTLRSLEIGSNRIGESGRAALRARFGSVVNC